ncbi:MAG: (2Fe-2S)-binding protein [Fidelibacterota bacterium]|nr:MAG: (2Fe-2S)-binding protein [Candidatus Neomarinimicrobiota bacterium]
MAQIAFTINGQPKSLELDPATRLLWVIRDTLGLTGTKYSCGMSLCGSCTVHKDGEAIRSCTTPVSAVAGSEITTIEGLSADLSHPLQRAWIEEEVSQCGYCQPGQIMIAAALLAKKRRPSDRDIDTTMSRALCRCGTYQRIRRAIHRAAREV